MFIHLVIPHRLQYVYVQSYKQRLTQSKLEPYLEKISRLSVPRVAKYAVMCVRYEICWWASLMFDLPTHEWEKTLIIVTTDLEQDLAKILIIRETLSLVG
jgi:hypothetical protein